MLTLMADHGTRQIIAEISHSRHSTKEGTTASPPSVFTLLPFALSFRESLPGIRMHKYMLLFQNTLVVSLEAWEIAPLSST